MDLLTILGILIGFSALIFGNVIEGGSFYSLLNSNAALIVIGGSFGATLLQTSKTTFLRAFRIFPWIFKNQLPDQEKEILKIIKFAKSARKDGFLVLENIDISNIDSFTRKALQLLIDGVDASSIRKTMEIELSILEDADLKAASFFEFMGGYAPTIGIIGAILGLINILGNLEDPSELGKGIAISFIATLYGVALANLLLLPIANKLKLYINYWARHREMVIDGIVCIAIGESPLVIEAKLRTYSLNKHR